LRGRLADESDCRRARHSGDRRGARALFRQVIWLGAIARAAAAALSSVGAEPVATVGASAITVSDVKRVASILTDPSLAATFKGVVDSEFADSPDAMTIGEDGLALLAVAFPAAAPLTALASLALELAPLVIANGDIKPDDDPVRDAQTAQGRGGRRD
jgi:hypothetical protein